MPDKHCTYCNNWKDLTLFRKCVKARDGRYNQCLECRKEWENAYRNRPKVRERILLQQRTRRMEKHNREVDESLNLSPSNYAS